MASQHRITRRGFLKSGVALAGVAVAGPRLASAAPRRTATDEVTLGNTGLKLSRLGIGLGTHNGAIQTAQGQEAFVRLVRDAYDRGIRYLDTADSYKSFPWIAAAIKDLPREQLFLQSKILGQPADVLAKIDEHRKTFDTDYIDSMLVHCMTERGWTEKMKRITDGFGEAKSRGWIRAKGVSCHSFPALQEARASDWPEVHLVRVNPYGRHMDGENTQAPHGESKVAPVMDELSKLHARGRGLIGMKICGNGDFKDPEQRERSIRHAMACPHLHAVVIGFANAAEIDEAISRINAALAAG